MKLALLLIPFLLLVESVNLVPEYTPVMMERIALEASVQYVSGTKSILNPGRMCLYDNWIFLVETYKGVHILDNSVASNPSYIGFLRVPGCQSIGVGSGIIYVDNAVDLVGVSFHPESGLIEEIARSKKVLPEINSPNGDIPSEYSRRNRPVNTEIVGWISNLDNE